MRALDLAKGSLALFAFALFWMKEPLIVAGLREQRQGDPAGKFRTLQRWTDAGARLG